jgi:hypothetical protein
MVSASVLIGSHILCQLICKDARRTTESFHHFEGTNACGLDSPCILSESLCASGQVRAVLTSCESARACLAMLAVLNHSPVQAASADNNFVCMLDLPSGGIPNGAGVLDLHMKLCTDSLVDYTL